MFTKEMQRALEADGEKLRQQTGHEHGPLWIPDGHAQEEEPPQQWFTCEVCGGSGEEVFGYWGYEPGCGHGHMMDDGRPCSRCGGAGGWLDDATANVHERSGASVRERGDGWAT